MGKINSFKKKYPKKSRVIHGKVFEYRYYKNEQSEVTVVLLTGGIGLSDLFLFHFEEFAKSYSVITFDYPIDYSTNQELCDAIAELLRSLHVRAYLIGQSLGGFIAQIIAMQHPDVVEGLILSNTGTLSTELDQVGEKCLLDMLKQIDKLLLLLKYLPFRIVKRFMKKAVLSNVEPEFENDIVNEFVNEMMYSLTKKYTLHMNYLLKDLKNHWTMEKTSFLRYQNHVLLILSADDLTFNYSVKQALIDLMPNPIVITDICGGHLALLLEIDHYAKAIKDFIESRD